MVQKQAGEFTHQIRLRMRSNDLFGRTNQHADEHWKSPAFPQSETTGKSRVH